MFIVWIVMIGQWAYWRSNYSDAGHTLCLLYHTIWELYTITISVKCGYLDTFWLRGGRFAFWSTLMREKKLRFFINLVIGFSWLFPFILSVPVPASLVFEFSFFMLSFWHILSGSSHMKRVQSHLPMNFEFFYILIKREILDEILMK